MLIAASYFWSDTLNAFVFGHGPASPTLADVLMLTSLDISTVDNSHLFDTKPSAKVELVLSAVGPGTFRSTEEQDLSMQRNRPLSLICGWISLYSVVDQQDQLLFTYRQQKD